MVVSYRKNGIRVGSRCLECDNLYQREQRIKNPQAYRDRVKSKRDGNKAEAIRLFGDRCWTCKQSYPACVYDFHHLKPINKKADATTIFTMCRDKMLEELSKCIMLCANCHRIEHYHDTNSDILK